MRTAAIILAAGSGKRMNREIPKQYLPLAGYPVIYYSLRVFQDSEVDEIVLVTGEDDRDVCRKDIVERYGFDKVHHIVAGGKERYDSVYQGLLAVPGADYVLIHDGARPLLTGEIIERSLAAVQEKGACAVAMPVKDTIKLADAEGYVSDTPDRSRLWLMQTPQAFSYSLICSAYEKLYRDLAEKKEVLPITDDAMVVEYAGGRVYLAEGSYENMKITTPEDLVIAEALLRHRDHDFESMGR